MTEDNDDGREGVVMEEYHAFILFKKEIMAPNEEVAEQRARTLAHNMEQSASFDFVDYEKTEVRKK